MLKYICITAATALCMSGALADESDETTEQPAATEPVTIASADQPKTLSGMSILGNEEAPKSLVIIPWKSSELGDDIDLSDSLDDRARPVDKDVFLRELNYYEIRSGK